MSPLKSKPAARKPKPPKTEHDSWRTVWKKPLGIFFLMSLVMWSTFAYAFVAFTDDIFERRIIACESSNAESRRTRALWNRVFEESSGVQKGFVIVPTPDKKQLRLPVQFDTTDPTQIEAFRGFINETYPIQKCDGRSIRKIPPAPSVTLIPPVTATPIPTPSERG